MYNEKFVNFELFIEHVNKKTYFRDVHLFVKRLKKVNVLRKSELVRKNA